MVDSKASRDLVAVWGIFLVAWLVVEMDSSTVEVMVVAMDTRSAFVLQAVD